jgi:hypothetical protein
VAGDLGGCVFEVRELGLRIQKKKAKEHQQRTRGVSFVVRHVKYIRDW